MTKQPPDGSIKGKGAEIADRLAQIHEEEREERQAELVEDEQRLDRFIERLNTEPEGKQASD